MSQSKPVSLLDVMTPEDRAKTEARAAVREAKRIDNTITREWYALSEFGTYFGWSAVRDVLDNKIDVGQMYMFIKGARKIRAQDTIDSAMAGMAARAGKPKQFDKIMKPYITEAGGVI